jgi:hypothetical protein
MSTTYNTQERNLPFEEQHEMDFINNEENRVTDTTVEKDIYDTYNFYPDAGF